MNKPTNQRQKLPADKKLLPPVFAKKMLRWYCNPSLLEEIEGDLQEQFLERVKLHGLTKARLFYILEVIRFIRPFTLEREPSQNSQHLFIDLLSNYLLMAWRNLITHKVFSFVSLFGLTIGMCCCFLILLFVSDELKYDTFHKKASRIYLVKQHANGINYAKTPPPLGPLLEQYFPEVQKTVRLYKRSASLEALHENKQGMMGEQYGEERFYFADSTIFQIFSFQFLKGDSLKALYEPYSLVVTDKMAYKYFGNSDPVGQTLIFEGKHHFKVSAVIKAFPAQSHLQIDFLAPYQSMLALESEATREDLARNWVITHSFTYVLLSPQAKAEGVNARFPELLKKYHPQQYVKDQTFSLEPLLDIHLHSNLAGQAETQGNLTDVYLFACIALVTLLIACINYINLSTARALTRAREVGIRKVLGAGKYQLIGQFLGESLLMCGVAFLCSLLLTLLLLPLLNELTGKALSWQMLLEKDLFTGYMIIFLFTALLAGLYPAFVLSSFKPIVTLKAKGVNINLGGFSLRKTLVAIQFMVSISLIACALIIFQQVQFLQNRPLGFEKEHIITIPILSENLNSLVFGGIDGSLRSRLMAFEEALGSHPTIRNSSLSSQLPGKGGIKRATRPQGLPPDQLLYVTGISVDYDFIKTYGLEVVAGRDFSADYGTDHIEAFIINEKAVEEFGWKTPGEALGKSIWREGKEGSVIGVIKDFHYQSLKEPINGFLLDVRPKLFTTLSIKLASASMGGTLSFVEKRWREHFPEKVFTYSFLAEDLAALYQKEQRLGKVITCFSMLAIGICCLGVYGLISFMTKTRKKEIGIRKVLGASTTSIASLLSKEFIILIFLASLISCPIAYLAMHKWLQNFTFHIGLSPWTFLLACLGALIITLGTAGYQTIRAAIGNPVNVLRED